MLFRSIITDRINYYPTNDTSSFIISHIASAGFSMPADVTLGAMYYVNSDTLTDFGTIEFSPNNGTTWIDLVNSTTYASSIYWNNPYIKPQLSGNSNGWKRFQVDIHLLGPIFNIQNGDTVMWRFTFISDGIQTNKDGLMFDSIFVWDVPPIGIENIDSKYTYVNSYPNPSLSIINLEFENEKSKKHLLKVYNNLGNTVYESIIPNNENRISLNIKDYSEGIYFFYLTNLDDCKTASGKFIKNK